jgi:DNA topoisomerase-2
MTYDGKRYTSWGISEKDGKGKITVTELPIGYWTSDFTEKLEKMKAEKEILNYKNYSTPKTVDFTITESKEAEKECDLSLYTYIHTSNMVLFSEEGVLKKYNSIQDILDSYCRIRYSFYVKRKEYKLRGLENLIKMLGNKKRFLQEVRDGDLKLFNVVKGKRESRKTAEIVKELEDRGYDKNNDVEDEGNEEEEEITQVKTKKSGNGYEYLMRMQISSITAEKIDKLKNDIESKIQERDTLKSTTEKEMWIYDLERFLEQYHPYIESLEKSKVSQKKIVRSKKT